MVIIRELANRVAPGGVLDLHFPIARIASKPNQALYWLRRKVPGVDSLVSIARGRKPEPMMEMNTYSLAAILALLEGFGFGTAAVDVEYHRNVETVRLAARLRS